MDFLWFGGKEYPPPLEWEEFVLVNQVYPGLDPRVIDELDTEKVYADLVCWAALQSYQNRNRK